MSFFRRFLPSSAANSHNLSTLKANPLSELSGSLGDLGTLLPLLIALTINSSISLSTTLIFTGIFNILTGLYFAVPLPVQPMKAIAAVAIANKYSKEDVAASGLLMGIVIFILSASGLLAELARRIPFPIVKGIQVGAGISLIISGGSSMLSKLQYTGPSMADNLILAMICALFLLLTTFSPSKRFSLLPTALILLIIGLLLALVGHPNLPRPALWRPKALSIPAKTFASPGLPTMLGQLPLTLLNSVLAVCDLSASLSLPQPPAPVPITPLAMSVALMNLSSCWLGSMPVCHGSGGLAAQYRFGARSGSSIVILGIIKMLLGLIFGDTLVELLQKFPKSLLGVMVIAAGITLASAGESLNVITEARDLRSTYMLGDDYRILESGLNPKAEELAKPERKKRFTIMLVTVAGLLAFKNDGVGFVAGLICHYSFMLGEWFDSRQRGIQLIDNEEALLRGPDEQ
ncbi:MAG: hypothetical protein M1834_006456 [Cirrosporium novae-zelandiae]|nr:MAG: hypothetical protein M1834_006456 [Cirrosporium novae-zelandiae]